MLIRVLRGTWKGLDSISNTTKYMHTYKLTYIHTYINLLSGGKNKIFYGHFRTANKDWSFQLRAHV